MEDFFSIGQIINTHGVRGELKIYPLTDDVNRFDALDSVYIDNEVRKVISVKKQPNKLILKIEGIDTLDEAVKYKNKYIKVLREDAVELKEGQYFIKDIIGCKVFDENDNLLGEVYDVINTKNNDVYCIKRDGKQDLLVPALKEIVLKIEMENKKIIIKAVEKWLED
ncbi:ribosome maturation factor RimM [Clostridium felsineum]|uniref:Ribosome maturation factor RimM n=1 Tax=Clostridium felsineum TaxID=36839 RepID=A0A1S8M9E6_9CLOT|nr:ribosome maturation factor RimM [Clostridium felsineum]MCR3759338.1 ribosome maturation factor RimM [Clostridium felsineum]URZ00778.1 Ribosome maturation factor RimM [Clostridium felsineum]URZ06583.1 Ribosome maturation factor RimM [Clostridium felsineum]URZ11618.1 Ribosome maturation factor RimM [Clostridium felsineum]URZ16181.1 Ribosome maturation factor RimM [Clostridium felsineum DSM 794]